LNDKPLVGEPFDQHPVAGVSRDDAESFCQWLSTRTNQRYRLPTEEEWNKAAGYDENVAPGETPDDLHKIATSASAQKMYPWGSQWPPTKDDGNYGIDSDPFPTTAPVMSFRPNQYGIYDLGGNLWEWVSDQYWNKEQDSGTLRGGAWDGETEWAMRSGCRFGQARYVGDRIFGFRVVLELDNGKSKTSSDGEMPDTASRRKLAQSVLSKGGTIKIRKEQSIVDVARIEDLPAGPFQLYHVDQVKGDFDDIDAALLAHFPELSSMRLNGCSVTKLPPEELPEEPFFLGG